MDVNEIIKQVNEVFREVFDDETLVIDHNTTANDIAEWDSLTHIELVVAVEKHFNIRFTSSEIQNFKNVGDMSSTILTKMNKQN